MPKDGPIIQEKPLRRPGARRQLAMGLFAVAVIAILAAGSYFLLRRRPETFTLRSFETAKVGRKDLLDTLHASRPWRACGRDKAHENTRYQISNLLSRRGAKG